MESQDTNTYYGLSDYHDNTKIEGNYFSSATKDNLCQSLLCPMLTGESAGYELQREESNERSWAIMEAQIGLPI